MKYLNHINAPTDLKKLGLKELDILAEEIRDFLVHSVSETGGHLSSNLGVTELTIALHYCFNCPKDKIVWDVGHQAYVHKILTGRKKDFATLRKYKGMSGFPKVKESPYDAFDTGHSSTSVSVAYGLAKSRDIKGERNKVVAVIGDGSMTGGLAYEGLNNAGRSETDLIVILNDNQMSISENVGALSRHLNEIRTAPYYLDAKKDVNRFLKGVPVVGEGIGSFIEKTKTRIKYFLLPGVLFEEMGFKYIGPVDGNNIEEMVGVLNKIKKIQGPVLVHAYTQKGRGYELAENQPMKFHGVDSFDVETGKPLQAKACDTYSDVFGKKLVEIASKNKRVAAITASMPAGTGLTEFQSKFPKRFFDVGIAEGHAVTFAGGMAKNGIIPVFAVYSSFLQRSYDQILHDVCVQNLPVVFAVDRAGIVGSDGETHQGIFDLSFLSHMPNMTVLAPKNGAELEMMLAYAVRLGSPCAVRYPRGEASVLYADRRNEIVFGKSETMEAGHDIAIISVGTMMDTANEVCARLKEEGFLPTLINARFVKPVDRDMVKELRNYQYIFTIEDNVIAGGFGTQVLQILSEENMKTPICRNFGIPNQFIEQGTRTELFHMLGLDSGGICKEVMKTMQENL